MMMITLLSIAMSIQAGAGRPGDPPGLRTVSQDTMSRVGEAGEVVVRTPEEWTALWRRHAGDAPAPKVDFATSMVVAVFLGTRMTAGFQVEITGARRDGEGWVIEWTERRPARGDVTAQVLTSPAHIVALPKTAGAIRFEKSDK